MKKAISVFAFLLINSSSRCDVIYFPVQYTFLSYSIETVYSFELIKKPKNTTVIWGGVGIVGSFFYLEYPFLGAELAVEKRHYFKPDEFKHFFISTYLGTAFMRGFDNYYEFGIVPGLKFNYKAQLSKGIFLEPYVSLSIPIVLSIDFHLDGIPFPEATIGVRIGFSTLKKSKKYKLMD